MIIELHVSVVNAAMKCIRELNGKEDNSLEKSTEYINLYNALDGGIVASQKKMEEQQKVASEAKKRLAEEAAAEKAKKAEVPVKETGPKLVESDKNKK